MANEDVPVTFQKYKEAQHFGPGEGIEFSGIEDVDPDFERDLLWAYHTLGRPVAEVDAPSSSAWYLREYGMSARQAFFKFFMDFTLKKKKDDERDVKWEDDRAAQFGFLRTLSDEYAVMSRESLRKLAEDDPALVIETLSLMGWMVVNVPAGSSGSEQSTQTADRADGLVLPDNGAEESGHESPVPGVSP